MHGGAFAVNALFVARMEGEINLNLKSATVRLSLSIRPNRPIVRQEKA